MLPVELVEAICGHLCSVDALLKARQACAALREPAADRIETLHAPGCCLPPEAWRAFRNAKSLVVRPRKGDPGGQLERLLGLLASLPPRLESLTIEANLELAEEGAAGEEEEGGAVDLITEVEQSKRLARALPECPCAASLRHLSCQQRLSHAASTALAQRLPELCSLSLVVSNFGEEETSGSEDLDSDESEDGAEEGTTWPSAALQVGLTSLAVAADNTLVTIDCARLAAAQQLRCLSIGNTDELRHPEALAQLAALTSLHLWDAGAEMWGVLRQLPQLQRLQCDSATVDLALLPDVQLARLTSFATKGISIEAPPGFEQQLLPGCLARLMPQLRRLDMVTHSDSGMLWALLVALQGLASLQELKLAGGVEREAWGQQQRLLGSLSGLTSLDLQVRAELERPACCPAPDLAGCPGIACQQHARGAARAGRPRSAQQIAAGL